MSFHELIARARGALGFGRPDRELGQELQFHLEMLEARHRSRGLDPAAARRAARLELGGDAQIAETWRDQRSLPFLDALRQDLRYGIRTLRRTPGFTAAALLTLTLGIGANTAIFTIVNAVLLKPLPYADPDRLVAIGDRRPDGSLSETGFATVADWRARSRSFEQLAMLRLWMPTLVTSGEGERLAAVRVSWNYFDTIGARPALGRSFTADDDRADHWRVLLLSDRLWRRRFGADPSVVGRTVVMNDREYRIVGVMPASFEPLDAQKYFNVSTDVWAPIGGDQVRCRRHCQSIYVLGRLKREVTVADATAEMNGIREQIRREYPGDYEAGSIGILSLHHALTDHVQTALYVLLAAVVFVLLIACANVANLMLARSVTRRRELSLRAVLGAGRGRIVRQLLTESLLLGAGGALGGLLMAIVGVRGLASVAPVSIPRLDRVTVDAQVLMSTAATAILASILFGLVPAWRGAYAAEAQQALAIESRTSVGGRPRVRAILVVADLVLALVLLAGAGLMLRTVVALTHTSPGFNATRVLALQFSLTSTSYGDDAAVVAFQQRILDRIRALPGVESAALAGQIPFALAGGGVGDCWGFHARGRMKPNPVDDPCVERFPITSDYLRVMDIPVLAGRSFTDADTATSQRVILISESTAKAVWGADNPIGSQVWIGNAPRGAWRTVVGVVADVHHDDITAPVVPAMYTPETQITSAYLTAVVRAASGDAAALSGSVRRAVHELDPAVPVYGVATLSSLIDNASAQRLFVMRLLGGFAIVAVLLAAIGLYGVVSYGVAHRTREVGVRVALGAQRGDVLRLVLSSGLSLVAIGVGAGLVVAFATTRYLGTLVFGVSPVDPATFAGAAALLTVVALVAHWVPIRRALRIDPASALRAE
jgi:putative ABC transport system permease protein